MCIIAYKEKGTSAKIDWQILKNCFENNNDGCGYAIAYNNSLILRKGFMRFDDFKASFENATKSIKIKDSAILLHFRITTHGGTSRENTHPFPIGKSDITQRKYKDLNACVAMNGISLSNVGYKDKISDTMDNVLNLINPLYSMCGEFWRNKDSKAIFDFLGAKWAILEKSGDIYSFGEFHKSGGWHYSNYSYLAYNNYKTNTYSCYSNNTYNSYIDYGYSYENYEMLGLKEFTGILQNIDTFEVLEIKRTDDYYIDSDGFIYEYDWDDDDFVMVDNLSVLQNDTLIKEVIDC